MFPAALSSATVVCFLFGQVGNYENMPVGDGNQRIMVSDAATTRSTRATNPVYGNYPAERVATGPRYADNSNSTNVAVNTANVPEDPQSALASKLLRDMLVYTGAEQNVRTLRLYDALERSSGAQQQYDVIKAYWSWNLAVAELHGVVEEEAILGRLAAPRTAHEQASHQASRYAAQARVDDSRLDVVSHTVDLQQATGQTSRVPLHPSDTPFVSAYNTNFQRLFPNNSAPVSLRKIHLTIPYILKVVRTRADSLAAAKQALQASESAYQNGQMPLADLLEALALVRNQRRAFLDSVHDYNYSIAEYALTAAGPGLQRDTVVSMLIKTSQLPYRGASYTPGSSAEYFVRPVAYETAELPPMTWEVSR
jgi:hypothetical protein